MSGEPFSEGTARSLEHLDSIRPSGRVVGAMSSIPSRLALSEPALRSILAQQPPPAEIFVSLPQFSLREDRHYSIPGDIQRLAESSRIKILRTEVDYGPGTKLLG